ncbi:MAG: FAD-dependent oxidoreductase [Candidatus Caenarcaniphilales bacterium]|nr:FAD-dependent oxidoreductase [Candidatus Caenarcaniphilales bacterium]
MRGRTVIIGGGLAGLAAASLFERRGEDYILLERSDHWGGKMHTIQHEDYRLDLGFQVLLSGYPSIKALMLPPVLKELEPCYFDSGALLLKGDHNYRLSNPLLHFADVWHTLTCPLLSWGDRFRVLGLLIRLWGYDLAEALEEKEWSTETTLQYLTQFGFSENFIQHFIKPFFGGVFGEAELETRAGVFMFCFLAFARGQVFIPKRGVGAFGELIASKISRKKLRTEVLKIEKSPSGAGLEVICKDDQKYQADKVILATGLEAVCELIGLEAPLDLRQTYTCLYFQSEISLYPDRKLFLNANPGGLISFGAQLNNIGIDSPEYLITVTVLTEKEKLEEKVKVELEALFPQCKDRLHFIKSLQLKGEGGLLKADLISKQKIDLLVAQIKERLPSGIMLAGEYHAAFSNQELTISSTWNSLLRG